MKFLAPQRLCTTQAVPRRLIFSTKVLYHEGFVPRKFVPRRFSTTKVLYHIGFSRISNLLFEIRFEFRSFPKHNLCSF
ncbi:hypothetical protein HanIR_Chr01g0016441 [Helianthus annuus]|nr:hypothetical protein HanIR_Chr01g0016441 [Helianthus annuus]